MYYNIYNTCIDSTRRCTDDCSGSDSMIYRRVNLSIELVRALLPQTRCAATIGGPGVPSQKCPANHNFSSRSVAYMYR